MKSEQSPSADEDCEMRLRALRKDSKSSKSSPHVFPIKPPTVVIEDKAKIPEWMMMMTTMKAMKLLSKNVTT